ncbi:CbtA family protein [Microvirga pudoricolor]|uniref:CbtA family protein n=1 Tax=Microvirga pudoricolor TaxID=2778729 RepID=UPI00194E5D4A|nr:CbtA family protein [Microvirga pudoricolor]MBM6592908.1 CbtA family protein [Microvirga pudoricolor]
MSLFRNIVFVAALAGLVAGIGMTGMQYASTVPLILKAETFENAAGGEGPATAAHQHAEATAAHSHDEADGWAPEDGFERSAYTALANVATAIGFALLLVVASEFAGGMTGWRQGMFWGLAGFAVFTLAPGLGLPPELPGMPAADVATRQVWWILAALATAAGLSLIVFRRSVAWAVLGVALIVAPHIVGAPQPESHETAVPHGLLHSFVVAVVASSLVFWVLLGGVAGYLRSRFMRVA